MSIGGGENVGKTEKGNDFNEIRLYNNPVNLIKNKNSKTINFSSICVPFIVSE